MTKCRATNFCELKQPVLHTISKLFLDNNTELGFSTNNSFRAQMFCGHEGEANYNWDRTEHSIINKKKKKEKEVFQVTNCHVKKFCELKQTVMHAVSKYLEHNTERRFNTNNSSRAQLFCRHEANANYNWEHQRRNAVISVKLQLPFPQRFEQIMLS